MRGSQILVPLLFVILLWKHVAPVLLLLVLALLLSSVLAPLADVLESRLGLSRLLAILAIYGTMILLLVLLGVLLGGLLADQVASVASAFKGQDLENLIMNLKDSVMDFVPEKLQEGAEERIGTLVQSSGGFLSRLVGDLAGLVGKLAALVAKLVLILVFTFILLLESRNFKLLFLRAVPNAYFELSLNLLDKINAQVSGYLRGQAIAAATVGVLSTIGLFIISQPWVLDINIPYFVIIGMLAGLANLIPLIGPFIGIVAAWIVYLMTPQAAGISAIALAAIAGMFFLVQMIDNFFVSPRIMSASVGIHPLMVIVVIMIGGSIMGPLGMLFAVPAYGVVKATTTELVWGLKAYRIL